MVDPYCRAIQHRTPLKDRHEQGQGGVGWNVELTWKLEQIVENIVGGDVPQAFHAKRAIVATMHVLGKRLSEIGGTCVILEESRIAADSPQLAQH